MANGKFAVFGNEFGIMVNIADYDTDSHMQTKKATYKDIQAWVMDQYGAHVTNLDISRTKKRCGLTQYEYKGHEASEGYYVPKPRERKQYRFYQWNEPYDEYFDYRTIYERLCAMLYWFGFGDAFENMAEVWRSEFGLADVRLFIERC